MKARIHQEFRIPNGGSFSRLFVMEIHHEDSEPSNNNKKRNTRHTSSDQTSPLARRTLHPVLRLSGFSMIEVSVAIAVMAFGIVAILGLFSLSMGGSKDSATDSVSALKAMNILANAESGSSYMNLLLDSTNGVSVSVDMTAASNNVTLFYDSLGLPETNSTRATYMAQVMTYSLGVNDGGNVIVNPVLENNPIILSLPPSTNMALLQINMIYPANAPPGQQTTNFFQTVIVNRGL